MPRLPVLSDPAEAFAVFASELNLTRAAAQLSISQPALHEKIKKLSAAVGTPLYENRRGTLALTREGRLLADLVTELQRVRDGFGPRFHAPRSEPVVLAAGEGSFLYLLGPVLHQTRNHDRPALRLELANARAASEAVIAGEADIGVGVFGDLPTTLAAGQVATFKQALACPHGHPLYDRRSVALADVADEALVVPPAGHPHRDDLASALAEQGYRLRIAVEAEGWELIMRFVTIGTGCAVVHSCVSARSGARLVPIRDLPDVIYRVIAREASLADPAVATLFDAIHRVEAPRPIP